jgi:hypothetical protein
MSPYRENYFNDTIKTYFDSLIYISTHKDVRAENKYSSEIGELNKHQKY